jgi:glycosyltransferase involved in cell wall biosynthesis
VLLNRSDVCYVMLCLSHRLLAETPHAHPARLLVVMPAFNEARGIRLVVEAVLERVVCDILVVDDGSSDDTAAEARAGGARVAVHPVNLGYGAALQTGYRFALRHGYDAVLQLDADGQHDPSSIPRLLAALHDADVVVGSRFLDPGSYRPPAARRAGMWLFAKVASVLAGSRITDPTSGFQAISREALRFYAHERYPVDYPDADVLAMVARSGLRLAEVPVRMLPSPDGKSMHAGVVKPLYYVFRMTLALFLVPLRREKR